MTVGPFSKENKIRARIILSKTRKGFLKRLKRYNGQGKKKSIYQIANEIDKDYSSVHRIGEKLEEVGVIKGKKNGQGEKSPVIYEWTEFGLSLVPELAPKEASRKREEDE